MPAATADPTSQRAGGRPLELAARARRGRERRERRRRRRGWAPPPPHRPTTGEDAGGRERGATAAALRRIIAGADVDWSAMRLQIALPSLAPWRHATVAQGPKAKRGRKTEGQWQGKKRRRKTEGEGPGKKRRRKTEGARLKKKGRGVGKSRPPSRSASRRSALSTSTRPSLPSSDTSPPPPQRGAQTRTRTRTKTWGRGCADGGHGAQQGRWGGERRWREE